MKRNSFIEIVKLLTKREDPNAGLSAYYIQLSYGGNVFIWMMKRVINFEFKNDATKNHLKKKAKRLMHERDSVQIFIIWKYSKCYLKLTDKDICFCCAYASEETFTHTRTLQSCSESSFEVL